MNIHTPQRLEGESQADYRARRRRSQWLVKVAWLQGPRAIQQALHDQRQAGWHQAFSHARGGL